MYTKNKSVSFHSNEDETVYQGQTAQASYSFSEHDFLGKTF